MWDNLPAPCVLLVNRGDDFDKGSKGMQARNVALVIPFRKTRELRAAVDCAL
jgi:hypothetical protein